MTRNFSVVCIGMNVESVVIPLLSSINNQTTSVAFEFVFVDDGSSDNTLAIVNDFFRENCSPNVTPVIVSNSKNMGINASRNIGINRSGGDLVLLCESDDIVDENWVEAYVGGFKSGKLFMHGKNIEFGSTGKSGQPRSLWGQPRYDSSSAKTCAGNNIAFTREAYERVGGFPPEFPRIFMGRRPGGDDTLFCHYAHLAGLSLETIEDAIVHYRQPNHWQSVFRQQVSYGMGACIVDYLFKEQNATIPRILHNLAYIVIGVVMMPFIVCRHGYLDFVGRLGRRIGRLSAQFAILYQSRLQAVLKEHVELRDSFKS